MKRSELEHVIRAAADVAGEDEIVVIGSQAILGGLPEAPNVLLWSQEADVYPRHAPERSEAIDGALGDGSQFHATEFAREAIAHGVVDAAELLRRVADLPLPTRQREDIARNLRALAP